MAAPALPCDWSAIRTMNANGTTLEALSATTGINLNTLKARSAREGWQVDTKALQQSKVAVAVANGQMQPIATSGPDLVANTLLSDGNVTRLHSMRYARNVTKHAADMSEQAPDEALTRASDVKAALDVAARAGNWMAKDGQTGTPLALFQVNGDMTINQG